MVRYASSAREEFDLESWLDKAHDEQLFLSVVSLGEIFKGLAVLPEGKRRGQINKWLEETLQPWFEGRVLSVTATIGKRWGILAGQRQLKGRSLNLADGLIAATALEYDLTVVTRNVSDFSDLGVRIFDPWMQTQNQP